MLTENSIYEIQQEFIDPVYKMATNTLKLLRNRDSSLSIEIISQAGVEVPKFKLATSSIWI